ncbi:MAG: hypothetical protein ACR2PH_13825 [Desulfobulbia bacterium]
MPCTYIPDSGRNLQLDLVDLGNSLVLVGMLAPLRNFLPRSYHAQCGRNLHIEQVNLGRSQIRMGMLALSRKILPCAHIAHGREKIPVV